MLAAFNNYSSRRSQIRADKFKVEIPGLWQKPRASERERAPQGLSWPAEQTNIIIRIVLVSFSPFAIEYNEMQTRRAACRGKSRCSNGLWKSDSREEVGGGGEGGESISSKSKPPLAKIVLEFNN